MPFSGDLPNPGIEPGSPALQAGSLLSEPPGKPFAIEAAGLANGFCLRTSNGERKRRSKVAVEIKRWNRCLVGGVIFCDGRIWGKFVCECAC